MKLTLSMLLVAVTSALVCPAHAQCPLTSTLVTCLNTAIANATNTPNVAALQDLVTDFLSSAFQFNIQTLLRTYDGLLAQYCNTGRFYFFALQCGISTAEQLATVTCYCNNTNSFNLAANASIPVCPIINYCTCPNAQNVTATPFYDSLQQCAISSVVSAASLLQGEVETVEVVVQAAEVTVLDLVVDLLNAIGSFLGVGGLTSGLAGSLSELLGGSTAGGLLSGLFG